MKKTPKLGSKLGTTKSHQSAAGLLGRTGGSGGLGNLKPAKSVPSASDLPNKNTPHTARAEPVASAKHTGKPETRRPTGRAISGG
jgi:hypothetical protein